MRKPLFLWIGLATATSSAVQAGLDYISPTKNVEIHAASGLLEWAKTSSNAAVPHRFDVRGGTSRVQALVHDEGLELLADRVLGDFAAGPKSHNEIRSATATGHVQVSKESRGSRMVMTGAVAKYTRSGTKANLNLSGPVHMSGYSAQSRRTLVANGSSASATLSPDTKSDSALRSATLFGPVTIDVTERMSTGNARGMHAVGKRLDIDNTTKPARLVLSGGAVIDSAQFGHMTANRITLELNERGEVVSASGGSK